jgi:hypothetical protein
VLELLAPLLEGDDAHGLADIARYLSLRAARLSGRLEDAAHLATVAPPRDHPLSGAFGLEAAEVHAERGSRNEVFRIAVGALRDRSPRGNRWLVALYRLILDELAHADFDARTVELLEDLGPRNETTDRVEDLAYAALDAGEPNTVQAAVRWLWAREHDRGRRSRYLGISAVAAILADDPDAFLQASAAIVARPGRLRRAVGRARERAFFAEADRGLAGVLREALPRMAEWGESRAIEQRRTRWLGLLVSQIQDFLRTTPDTAAREELLELYRIASAMLRDAPRGYPEHVGDAPPPPIVLGRVSIGFEDPGTFPIPLDPRPVYSLTLVPHESAPAREWAFAFPIDAMPAAGGAP